MNYKSILFFLGIFTLFVSIFSFLNILYSIYFDSISGFNSYVITLLISLVVGFLFTYVGRDHGRNISLSDQIVFIVLSFIIIPFLISIPYFFSIYNIGLLNSYFESVSGLTTTGFTIMQNVSDIDEPLMLWRSSSQWMGGLLFLLATIGTIGSKQIKIKPAYLISGGASGSNFYKNFNYNFIKILLIYLFSTIFVIPDEGFANVFFSITSSISTSGITTYSSNIDLSLFFILLTIVGGSLISTSSGFKYTRIYILLKNSYQEIYRLVKPINVIDKNLFNTESKIDDQDVKIAFLVFVTFIVSIFILSSILTLDNLSFENSFKLSILTLTNTVSSAIYGMDGLNFLDLNNFTKMSLIIFMILGKIEIIAVIYFIRRFIFRE